MTSALAFQRFAASCEYPNHGYLNIKEGAFIYKQDSVKSESTSVKKVTQLAIEAFKATPTLEMKEALRLFHASLKTKYDNFFSDFIDDMEGFEGAICHIKEMLETHQQPLSGSEEAVFRLRFISELPDKLKVKHAPKTQSLTVNWLNGEQSKVEVKEWEIIEWLSKRVYLSETVAAASSSEEKWKLYSEIMTGAYKGDHLLISDDEKFNGALELIRLGGIIRVSSHSERGRAIKGWNEDGSPQFGGNLYEDIKGLDYHKNHWSLEADHVSEILFFATTMRKRKDGTLICAKTARQVDKLIEAKKLNKDEVDQKKVYHFTAFQFEWAPDCEGYQYFNRNYWKHKIFSSYLYRGMKRMGYEDANVGPYGFGRTDTNPRVIIPTQSNSVTVT